MPGGQHQDRHPALGTNGAAGGEPVEVRHQDVEDDHVGRRRPVVEKGQCLEPVLSDLDLVTLELERA